RGRRLTCAFPFNPGNALEAGPAAEYRGSIILNRVFSVIAARWQASFSVRGPAEAGVNRSAMSTWLARVLTEEPGFEAQLVARYSERLLVLARRQLPTCIRSRVDPEDVVQSVYRSFFQRLHQRQFAFEQSH